MQARGRMRGEKRSDLLGLMRREIVDDDVKKMKRITALAAATIVVLACGKSPVGPTAPQTPPVQTPTSPTAPTGPTALGIVVSGPSTPVSVGVAFDVNWTVNDSSPLQRLRADWAGQGGNAATEAAPAPPSGTLTLKSMVPGTFLLTLMATTASGNVLQAAITVTVVS